MNDIQKRVGTIIPKLKEIASLEKKNDRHLLEKADQHGWYTQKKKLLNELKKIRVNFSTKFNYIFPPKSNLFEMSCCNLVV